MFSFWSKKQEQEQKAVIADYSKLNAQQILKREDDLIILANKYLNNPDWHQFQQGQCNMYSLNFEGRVATKGCMILQFAVNKIIEFLKDPINFKKTDVMMQDVKILETGSRFQIAYIKFKGIWPVASRDMIIYGIRKQVEDKFYLVSKSIPYNLQNQDGSVRAQCHIGAYILEILGPSTTRVTYISDADVKGMIPSFVKNMVSKYQASVPVNLNARLKTRAEKLSQKELEEQRRKEKESTQQVD